MKDSELRGHILQYFYDRRRKGILPPPKAADLGVEITEQDILRICGQLGEQNLLNWKDLKTSNYATGNSIYREYIIRSGKINVFGVDVVEGNLTPAIKVEFVQHNNNTVTISGSTNVNNIIGSNNTLTLAELSKAIEAANATPQEKEEAKTLLQKFLNHPLVSAIAGSAVGLLGP